MASSLKLLVAFAVVLVSCSAYLLPGVLPVDYDIGEDVDMKVNKLTSVHTQLPYDYYSLKFCKPLGGVESYSENLGELLSGDRIENSPYELNILENVNCRVLCQVNLAARDSSQFKSAIQRGYHHNWIIDNLPAASIVTGEDEEVRMDYTGFPVGYRSKQVGEHYYIYNHVNLLLDYHELDEGDDLVYRIVGFTTEPFSIAHKTVASDPWDGKMPAPPIATCSAATSIAFEDIKSPQIVPPAGPLLFSYSVTWRPSSVRWASRWDVYLNVDGGGTNRVHWLSITNSIMVVLFLASMVGMILFRTLRGEISHYNALPTDEDMADEREETGWKLVHADVFRPPLENPMAFCVCVGSGVQILACAFVGLFFAAFGYVSPVARGSIMITALLLFVLMGFFGGYTSAYMYKTFKGKEWQRCTTTTALGFPSLVFFVFMGLNILLKGYGSTEAVPFLTLLSIIALWFGISVPMTFMGAFLAYKRDPLEWPVVTSNIPRQIPKQEWYMNPYISCALGGALPFGACFVELYFVMSSIWMDQYYLFFGFLFVVFVILTVTCAEVAIVMTYFQLCAEDYHWWWRSFLVAGATAAYVMLYSFAYFLHLQSSMAVTYALYFGYMSVISIGLFLMTGAIGFLAALGFNLAIYSSVKVD
jgi:transmembrane 9 superfamily protein 2/4